MGPAGWMISIDFTIRIQRAACLLSLIHIYDRRQIGNPAYARQYQERAQNSRQESRPKYEAAGRIADPEVGRRVAELARTAAWLGGLIRAA